MADKNEKTTAMDGPVAVTFEEGYDELKRIVHRLAEPDVPVQEMFDLFRKGKGLEIALRAYLSEREGELDEIERGENLPKFDIVTMSAASEPTSETPVDAPSTSSEDDIPF